MRGRLLLLCWPRYSHSGVALFVVRWEQLELLRNGIGGLSMGMVTAAMDYIGMEAMPLPAMYHCSPGLATFSVILAIAI
jgi:NO-binding membrane sensor protein with MHYT domain